MQLTAGQLAYLRSEVGDSPSDADLQAAYDRLGTVQAVAAEVTRGRLATLLSGPSSFTLPGVYSESNDATIRALQAKADRLEAAAVASVTPPPVTTGRVVRADRVR